MSTPRATQALAHVTRPSRLSEIVHGTLDARIRGGEFPPGTRLPPEQQLAVAFGVSRAVVREAVARLKADGSIETRQGAGAFVPARPGAASFRAVLGGAAREELRHLMELRAIVEVAAAELAAQRHTKDDLQTIRRALGAMSAAIQKRGDGASADDGFHRAVAAASHNPYLSRFVEFLGHQFSDTRRPVWTAEGHRLGRPEAAQREHEVLFAAIAAGNVRGAGRAAAAHLRRSASRLGLDGAGKRP
jgi:GntR family transcriptional regulator, transcriptional repressor for pyruvate dehydrogenase complex